MMKNSGANPDWLDRYKKKIIAGIVFEVLAGTLPA